MAINMPKSGNSRELVDMSGERKMNEGKFNGNITKDEGNQLKGEASQLHKDNQHLRTLNGAGKSDTQEFKDYKGAADSRASAFNKHVDDLYNNSSRSTQSSI